MNFNANTNKLFLTTFFDIKMNSKNCIYAA